MKTQITGLSIALIFILFYDNLKVLFYLSMNLILIWLIYDFFVSYKQFKSIKWPYITNLIKKRLKTINKQQRLLDNMPESTENKFILADLDKEETELYKLLNELK